MAKKEYIERAAGREDGNYCINVTAIAPMKELPIKNKEWTKATGKEETGKSNSITSLELNEGIVIIAEDGNLSMERTH